MPEEKSKTYCPKGKIDCGHHSLDDEESHCAELGINIEKLEICPVKGKQKEILSRIEKGWKTFAKLTEMDVKHVWKKHFVAVMREMGVQ